MFAQRGKQMPLALERSRETNTNQGLHLVSSSSWTFAEQEEDSSLVFLPSPPNTLEINIPTDTFLCKKPSNVGYIQ